jgi:CubicO group peptidase (beta-lactamase class C family)
VSANFNRSALGTGAGPALARVLAAVRRLATAAAIAWSATLHAQAPSTAATQDIDRQIAERMARVGIVGLGAAIIVDRQVAWMNGYGFADKGRTRPFTPRTVMNVGSIAKTVTGVAMMRAVQDGLLSLDEDINRYLPFRVVNPYRPQETITLRHVATHTSGIRDRWEVYARTYHYGVDSPVPLGSFLADYFTVGGAHYARENFVDARPGTRREYANVGAALAGYIVERAVGEPLNVFTRKQVFAPLGMTNTGWLLSEVDLANHSALFVAHNGFIIPIPLYGGTTYPDGGLRTSVEDLSRFFIALLRGGEYAGVRILDEAAALEMQRFQFTDANRPENFPASDGNSGLFWRTKFRGQRVGHGGSDPGVQTEMLADRAGTLGVVLLVNTSLSGREAAVAGSILDLIWQHGESLREARKPSGDDPHRARR